MSLHKSLKYDKFKGRKKSVNKKLDRIKKLLAEGKLDSNNVKIYGLPKEKIVKIKITKVKKEKKEEKPIDILNSDNA